MDEMLDGANDSLASQQLKTLEIQWLYLQQREHHLRELCQYSKQVTSHLFFILAAVNLTHRSLRPPRIIYLCGGCCSLCIIYVGSARESSVLSDVACSLFPYSRKWLCRTPPCAIQRAEICYQRPCKDRNCMLLCK